MTAAPVADPAEISRLAYALWCARGCPDGSPDQDWLEAERQLALGAKDSSIDPASSPLPSEEAATKRASDEAGDSSLPPAAGVLPPPADRDGPA